MLLDCAGAVHADTRAEAVLACPEGGLAAAARAGGLSVLTIPERRPDVRGRRRDRLLAPLRLLDHARELRELAGTVKPDAVVAWNMRSAIASLALPARCPLGVGHNDLLPGRLSAAAVRVAARRAQVVLVPSRTVAEDLGVPGAPVRVVYPGIDLERFGAPWEPADPPEVVVLGALMDWKRPDLALAVLERARRSIPEAAPAPAGSSAGRRPDGARFTAPASHPRGPDRRGPHRRGRPAARAGPGQSRLPASLRAPRAVRAGGGRSPGRRLSGGGARCGRAGGDRRRVVRAALSAAGRRRGRPGGGGAGQ